MLYQSTGIIKYEIVDIGFKLFVEVDQQLADYYRKLIPKYQYVTRQRYGAHISVIRYEEPPNIEYWGKYEGQEIDFFYDSDIKFGKVYYWLNAFSKKLEEVRLELGLPVSSPYTLPPDGFDKCFHITIGNTKELQ